MILACFALFAKSVTRIPQEDAFCLTVNWDLNIHCRQAIVDEGAQLSEWYLGDSGADAIKTKLNVRMNMCNGRN